MSMRGGTVSKFLILAVFAGAISFSAIVAANPAIRSGDITPGVVKTRQPPPQQACANAVVMYSLSYCPACTWQRNQLNQNNVKFSEIFVDKQPQFKAELAEKAKKAGLRSYGYPTLDIGGALLVNPHIDQIKKHLCS